MLYDAYRSITNNPPKMPNLSNLLETNQCIYGNRRNYKTGTLTMNFHKPAGEANTYVQFGYSPLKIFNHTWGQVSESINADPIDIIHTSQK